MRSEPFVGARGHVRTGLALSGVPLAAKQSLTTGILGVAMLAFELFNFDTTRFALHSLLGDASFSGVRWAAILALAFCAIDFAGLVYLCAPVRERETGPAFWYLTGAWLLGATMNALMTWWAITLTLLSHPFGNEVLSRVTILELVPLLVAGLVWLTRILFIGAFAISAGPLVQDDRAFWPERRPGLRRPAPPALASSRPAPRPPLPVAASARLHHG